MCARVCVAVCVCVHVRVYVCVTLQLTCPYPMIYSQWNLQNEQKIMHENSFVSSLLLSSRLVSSRIHFYGVDSRAILTKQHWYRGGGCVSFLSQ